MDKIGGCAQTHEPEGELTMCDEEQPSLINTTRRRPEDPPATMLSSIEVALSPKRIRSIVPGASSHVPLPDESLNENDASEHESIVDRRCKLPIDVCGSPDICGSPDLWGSPLLQWFWRNKYRVITGLVALTAMFGMTFLLPESRDRVPFVSETDATDTSNSVGEVKIYDAAGHRAENYLCQLRDGSDGFTGVGFVDFLGQGSWLEFTVTVTDDSPASELEVKYSSAFEDRPVDVLVDGIFIGELWGRSTYDWNTWATEQMPLSPPLAAGEHKIRLFARRSAGPNVDWLAMFSVPDPVSPFPSAALAATDAPSSEAVVPETPPSGNQGSVSQQPSSQPVAAEDNKVSTWPTFPPVITQPPSTQPPDTSPPSFPNTPPPSDQLPATQPPTQPMVTPSPTPSPTQLAITPSPTPPHQNPVTPSPTPSPTSSPTNLPVTPSPTNPPIPDPLQPAPTPLPTVSPSPQTQLQQPTITASSPALQRLSVFPIPQTPTQHSQKPLPPSPAPSVNPTVSPVSSQPTSRPTYSPTPPPTPFPTPSPTLMPTPLPTPSPTPVPTLSPTPSPIPPPTLQPTRLPTLSPQPQPQPQPQPTSSPPPPPPPPAPAPPSSNFAYNVVLASGTSLGRGTWVSSPNNRYKFGLNSEGELRLLDGTTTVWKSGVLSADKAYMQTDGNFLTRLANSQMVWQSHTSKNNGAFLVIDDGGQAYVRHRDVPLWVVGVPRGVYTGPPDGSLTYPLRGAFYYAWYPETWSVNGKDVFYRPTLGKYANGDPNIQTDHVRALDYANVDVSIVSWWGPDKTLDRPRILNLMDRTKSLNSPVKWTVYHEEERLRDMSVSELKADLDYLKKWFAWHESWAHIDGKPIIFVYNEGGCEVADRWTQAAGNEWYVVLKLFPQYKDCPSQPNHWHQYGPSTAVLQYPGASFTISPGFWRSDLPQPDLPRVSKDKWTQAVLEMVNSGSDWQLITTFNEWGEGTAVEGAQEWGSDSGYGYYMDALHDIKL